MLVDYVEGCISTSFNTALNAASAPDVIADHRRRHRPGHPARIESDPELRTFIAARFDTMICNDIAAFPPSRRVSRSSIPRCWQKHRTTLRNNPPPNRGRLAVTN